MKGPDNIEIVKVQMQIQEINKDLGAAHDKIRDLEGDISRLQEKISEADKSIIRLKGELNPVSKIVWAVTIATIGNALSLFYMYLSSR